MTSLVENIISLENEAEDIIEKARAGSKEIIRSVDDEIARYRDHLTGELETRLAHFRTEAEKKFEEIVADTSKEHERHLRSVRELPDSFAALQIERVLDRFNNW